MRKITVDEWCVSMKRLEQGGLNKFMKTLKLKHKMRFVSLLLTLLLVVMMAVPMMPGISIAAEATVDLGTAESFAVLAGSTITNTGSTVINGSAGGDIGVSPGSAITGFPPGTVSGEIYSNDAVAIQAQIDLGIAYDDAAGRTTTAELTGQDLGGLTLTPGVYEFSSSAQLTGTLALDALGDPDAVFIFQIGSTLTTASSSSVELINGAQSCNVFWQVGSSATLGTSTSFVGHILALTSITANTGATVQGQLLAQNGAVTLDTNTITNDLCEDTEGATLNVIKQVINDDNGSAVADDFTLYIKTSSCGDVAESQGNEDGTSYILAAGSYVVSEGDHDGYRVSYSGDSDSSGNITLASGNDYTVTVTNNDIYQSSGGGDSTQVYPPLINVVKTSEPMALVSGPGPVEYTYVVTNPGTVALSNVSVTDDKVISVDYVSGDANADNLLQTSETWIYTGRMNLNATTTNTATAQGSANGVTATDTAFATVVVTPAVPGEDVTPTGTGGNITPTGTGGNVTPTGTGGNVTTTVTGGQLPNTATPWYNVLLAGAALILLGAVGWKSRKRYE
jgi:LPXTG-motif cell wall-anchored protein